MIAELFSPKKENQSEITIAKQKLQRAQDLFDCATDASFDYANAELTAAIKFMDYVLQKSQTARGICEWKSA